MMTCALRSPIVSSRSEQSYKLARGYDPSVCKRGIDLKIEVNGEVSEDWDWESEVGGRLCEDE